MQAACILYDKGYMLGPQLGKGKYAKVKMAERISDSQVVAAKIIFRHRAAPEFLQTFLPRELSIALSLRHPNIIQVYEIIQTPELVCVAMEYASRGDLLDLVRRHGSLQEHQAGLLFGQVCAGVAYLHNQNICHRDLKCENILLRKDMTVALADFGFSRSLLHPQVLSSTYCGSAAYASPELLRGTPYMPLQNDIWSLGCVLYIMVTGQMPFHHTNTTKMMYRQLKGKVSYQHHETVSLACRSLIAGMLEPNPSLRFEIETVQRHPWVQPFTRLIGALQGQGICPNQSQGEGLVFAEERNVTTHNMDPYGKNIPSTKSNHLARHSMTEDESFVNSSHLGSEDSVDGLVRCGEETLVRTLGEPCVLQSAPKGEGGLVRDSSISDFGTDVSVCSLGNNSSRTSLSLQPPVSSDPSQHDQQVIPKDADQMPVCERSSQPKLTSAAAQEVDLNSCLSRLVEVKLATSCQLLARAALSGRLAESLVPAELDERAELATGGLAASDDKISVTRVVGLGSNGQSPVGGLSPDLNRVTQNESHSASRDSGHQPRELRSESPTFKHQLVDVTESLPCNKHIAGIKESPAWKQLLENMKTSSSCNQHLAKSTVSPARERSLVNRIESPSQVRRSTEFEGLTAQSEGVANNRGGSVVGLARRSKNNTPPGSVDLLTRGTDGLRQGGAGVAGTSFNRSQAVETGARSTTERIPSSQIESRTTLKMAGVGHDKDTMYNIGQTSLVSVDQDCRSAMIGQNSVLSRWRGQDLKPISKTFAIRTDQESKSATGQASQVVIGQTEQTLVASIGKDCRSVMIGQKSVLSRWHVQDSKPNSKITYQESNSASGQAGQVLVGQTDQTSVVSIGHEYRSVVTGQKSLMSRGHDKDSKLVRIISTVKADQDSRSASGEAGQVSTKSSPGFSSPNGQAGERTNVGHQRHLRSGSGGLAPASDHSSGSGSPSNYLVTVGATVGQLPHISPGLDAVSVSGRVAQMRQVFELGNQSGSPGVSSASGQPRNSSS